MLFDLLVMKCCERTESRRTLWTHLYHREAQVVRALALDDAQNGGRNHESTPEPTE